MRNQVFNTFWHGPALSPLHWACVQSYIDRGHQMRVFAYRPVALPAGVILEDARQVIPESELFEFDGYFSAFSNIFRYKLLLEQGGWWVDADVFCQDDDIAECDYAFAAEDDMLINGAVLKFPAGDPTLREILEASMQVGRDLKVWGQLGPHLLTRHLAGRPFEGRYGTTQAFYPVHWIETHMFWLPHGREPVTARCAGSPFVHLWAAMFRQLGIDLQKPPPQGSYLRWLAEQCNHPSKSAPRDEMAEAMTMVSIRAFLAKPQIQARWRHLFGDRPSMP
jgi:hypothetical protein